MSERGKIEWNKMGWRWWIESIAKIVVLIGLFSLTGSIIGDDQPKWVMMACLYLTFMIGLPLLPFPPREGEQNDFGGLNDSILASGLMMLGLMAIAALVFAVIAYFIVVPAVLKPVVAYVSEHIVVILLATIALLLYQISIKLNSRK